MYREAWHAAVHGVTKIGHDWAIEPNWNWDHTYLPQGAIVKIRRVSVHVKNVEIWHRIFIN